MTTFEQPHPGAQPQSQGARPLFFAVSARKRCFSRCEAGSFNNTNDLPENQPPNEPSTNPDRTPIKAQSKPERSPFKPGPGPSPAPPQTPQFAHANPQASK